MKLYNLNNRKDNCAPLVYVAFLSMSVANLATHCFVSIISRLYLHVQNEFEVSRDVLNSMCKRNMRARSHVIR